MMPTSEAAGRDRPNHSVPIQHAPGVRARLALEPLRLGDRASALHNASRLLLVVGVYFVAGKFGLTLASVNPSATAIWPCTGIALASLLLFGMRMWPAVLAGAFLVNVTTAGSILSSLGVGVGNTLEAVVGAHLVQRFAGGRNAFERAPDTFRYAGLVALACVVSATLGVVSLALTGFAPWERSPAIWLTWWLGDVGGGLVVAPMLLVWSEPISEEPRWKRAGEAVALVACVILTGWLVFRLASPFALSTSLKFLCVPPLLWAAFRFGQRMGTLSIVILSVLAVWGTLGQLGMSHPLPPNASLLIVQVFLSVTAVTILALTALVAERRKAMQEAEAATARLREAVIQVEAFSHAISHDLRSPIGTVLNCVAILEEDHATQLGGDGLRLLRRIQSASDAATRLLEQLALYAWSGPRDAESAVVDMTALAREAFAEVASSGDEIGDAQFDLADLPPAVGSAPLLVRVFRNLLSNAVKYTRGRETRRIEVTAALGRDENTYYVRDNGFGFDPAESEALFEPFHRLSGARGVEGSGVGLAVVAKIIRRHGGRVWAESDGATGARFGFTLRSEDSVR